MVFWKDSYWDNSRGKVDKHKVKGETKLSPEEVVKKMPKMMKVYLILYKRWWSPTEIRDKFHDDTYRRALYDINRFLLDRREEKTEWGRVVYYTVKKKYKPYIYRYFLKRFGYDPNTLLKYL